MTNLILFIEIFFSIHALLFLSSFFVGGRWLSNEPSFKLKCVRLLLISCVVSPLAVHCIKPAEKPLILKFVSLDAMQDYASQPLVAPQKSDLALQVTPHSKLSDLNYSQLLFILLGIVALWRGSRLTRDLRQLNLILHSAIPYRTCGRLMVKVSPLCHIPFSIRLFNKAYIILPVSLLSSSQDVKIAIAHEGQHHRNGDCLWAYFIEGIRIIFLGNPGVARWHRILSELQELSCDEALVGHQKISAHDYGHCLFHVVQAVSQSPKHSQREFACTVGMAWGRGKQEITFIIRRINMLTNYKVNKSKHLLLGTLFVGIAITAPICTAYAALGSLSGSKAKEVDTSLLNPEIQNIAVDEITAAVKKYHAKSGAIAIVEPSTGKIIAFAEAGTSNGAASWKSRIFAPASTIKPFVAAAAIDSGVVSETTSYDCHSPYYVDGVKFTNYNSDFGSVSVTDALAKSVNVCLIKIAQNTGPVVFRDKLAGFGFNMNNWPQKGKSEALQLATASLGDIPVTLETLTKTYAVLANKGHLPQANAGSVILETTANSVTRMLERSVTSGTGKQAAIDGISVAGKTGTLVDETNGTHLALFGGYVPANAPRFAMVVILEDGYSTEKNGEKSTTGGTLAAPVFHNVAIKAL